MKSDRLQLWYNLIRSAACLYVSCMCGFLWLLCQKMFPQSSLYASFLFFAFFLCFYEPTEESQCCKVLFSRLLCGLNNWSTQL